MSRMSPRSAGSMDELRAIYFSVMGVRFAANVDQIAEMVDVPASDRELPPLLSLWERLSFTNGLPAVYKAPKGLVLKREDEPVCLIVDEPSDIMIVNLDFIREMPLLIRSACSTLPVWGAIVGDDVPILLLNLDSLHPEIPDGKL